MNEQISNIYIFAQIKITTYGIRHSIVYEIFCSGAVRFKRISTYTFIFSHLFINGH